MTLGERIAERRVRAGLSQEELAERLGVSRQSVSKWETDASVPELEKLVKLGEVFDMSLDALIKGETAGGAATEAVQAPQQTKAPGGGRRAAGYVYLILGGVVTLLMLFAGSLLGGLVFGLPFYICAAICLTSKGERPGLWCGWVLFVLADLYLGYATGVKWTAVFLTLTGTPEMGSVRLLIAWLEFLGRVLLIAWSVWSFRKVPLKVGRNRKRDLLLGAAAMAAAALVDRAILGVFMDNFSPWSSETYDLYYPLTMALDYARVALLAWMAALGFRVWKQGWRKK